MMWIVRLALKRPYTFVVASLLISILGIFSIESMPTDIFPSIDIPIVTIVWSFNGLSAEQMANRIVTQNERQLTTTVNDIDHIESQSYNGVALIKVFFQPHVNLANSMSQVTALCQSSLRSMPTGTVPPAILEYSASTVPVLQLGLGGDGLNEQQLSDIGSNSIRPALATIEGAQTPPPFGGQQRQIMVDIDLPALQARKLTPADVVSAINAQNLIAPSGTMKIGHVEYSIETNSAPSLIEELNNLPVRSANGTIVYIRDVAHVRDGSPPQTNIVRVDGHRSVLMNMMKTGSASTLTIIAGVRNRIEEIKGQLPARLKIAVLSDQSIFVRGAIDGVLREAIIAACLTSIMILLFLGSWRSTCIIAVSIPLSILTSICALWALNQTINIMTLGGLALAVGILVDDATVEIENINRNLAMGKEIRQAILDGAEQIATPAFVSTISICIVFVPMFFLSGVAKYLFIPLAEAVVFAMLASYLLSRTLVPTMALYLLKPHDPEADESKPYSRNPLVRFQANFEVQFEKLRASYARLLSTVLTRPKMFLTTFLSVAVVSLCAITPQLGSDFFPNVQGEADSFKIHLRASTGTRIEDTAALCDDVERIIRKNIPANEIGTIIDNIGLPNSGLNMAYTTSAPIGPSDADIQVELHKNHHPTGQYLDKLRLTLAEEFPGVTFYVLPVDMVTQILNFGLPSPIDIQFVGPNTDANRVLANQIMDEVRYVPGAKDLRIQQPSDYPTLMVDVNRTRAQEVGVTQQNVTQSILVALSGSFQTSPNYYMDPRNGVTYNITTRGPQYKLQTIADLRSLPVAAPASSTTQADAQSVSMGGSLNSFEPVSAPHVQRPAQVLGNVAGISPMTELGVVSHYDIQPVVDILANVDGSDLGSVTSAVNRIISQHKKDLKRGSKIILRGQSETMYLSFRGLIVGLAIAILLVYLLIVINFQSWLDPLLIIAALPAALAGIVWFLFVCNTHLSVPALTGSIMCMGVATANSILVVNFARDQIAGENHDPHQAALSAGIVRFRPVIMTALAMIIGMLPMAVGMGDGGEQNAPLGRAVIGGLLAATTATLFFVPAAFSVAHGWLQGREASSEPMTGAIQTELPE
jgi:multidrug efflux pump subunit AcrB